MSISAHHSKTWCEEDQHLKYIDYSDFNEWFDGAEGLDLRLQVHVEGLANPSKAFFAGDREAYIEALDRYRLDERNLWLGKAALEALSIDDHWFDRNSARFDDLCAQIEARNVVPFIGAGISQPGGFPTWREHLKQQGRTAGLDPNTVTTMLDQGLYEVVVDLIEQKRGPDVFAQELRDVFGRNGKIPSVEYLITDMFKDTVITTNYDRLIEQSFDLSGGKVVDVVTPENIMGARDASKVAVIKLHGHIATPGTCILSRNQYDSSYGIGSVDLSLPVPRALSYYYQNSSLLFLGCSLNLDRTIQVFEAVKAKARSDGAKLPQHFSLEQCPADEPSLISRNEYLLRLGITPIWFPTGKYEFIERILRLARNELRYRRA